MKIITKEFFKFLIVGGGGFISNLFLTYFLTDIVGFWYITSFMISAIITWTGMFFANLLFTFRDEDNTSHFSKYVSFIAGYTALFFINLAIVFVLTSFLSIHYLVSVSIGTVFITALTFLYSKFFVYQEHFDSKKKYFYLLFILIALLAGLINVSVHFFRIANLSEVGKEYRPYSLIEDYDATNVIGPRIREALEGNLMPSDIDLYEYKDAPSFWPPLTPLFFAPFGIFTSSVTKVVIVSDFIFPVIIFILFYFLFHSISDRKYLSLWFGAFISLCVYFSINVPPPNFDVLKIIWDTFWPFSDTPNAYLLTKRESLIPALIPLLLSFTFFFRAVKNHKTFDIVMAGIFLSLNAYTYPYHFIYAVFSTVIFYLLYTFKQLKNKNVADLRWLQFLGIFALSAFIVLIPFIFNQIELRSLPQYKEILGKFGMEIGREFRWEHSQRYISLIILSLLVWFWGKKYNSKNIALLSASILLAGIAVLNMQIVLGFSVQSDHWLNRDIVWGLTIAYFILFVWLYDYLLKKGFNNKIFVFVGVVLLCCLSLNSIRYQYLKALRDYNDRTIPTYYAEAFEWLNKNTEKDSVVMTPSLVSNYFLPLYTHSKIFVPRALNSVAPESEFLERLFITYKLFKIEDEHIYQIFSPENFEVKSFDAHEKAGITYFFAFKYLSKDLRTYTGSLNDNVVPESEVNSIVGQFNDYKCIECLNRFRADYVFVGPQENKIADTNLLFSHGFEKVYTSSEVSIYKITNLDFSL